MKMTMLTAVLACAAATTPALAQSQQAAEMRYRAELARQRSREHTEQVREQAYIRQQQERLRQTELRARDRSHPY